MIVSGISNSPLYLNRTNHSLILQNLGAVPLSPTPKKPTQPSPPPSSTFSTSSLSSSTVIKWRERLQVSVDRRMFNLSMVGLFLLSWDQAFSRFLFLSKALASPVLELDRYTDSNEGFTLLIPSSWVKAEKAGATVLFEDEKKKANNLGVVVSPTRISSLGEFGTPQFVADKLIQAERRKESTKEVELISVSERLGHAGLQVYEFEYKIDSTRGGLKRVFSAAFATSKKLFLLNIVHSDGFDSPLDMERRMILEQVLHSFDAVAAI